MTNSKSTKRALISSALAVVICVAMFIGTTFAWFTDTASTGVNKIQAGTLKIKLLDKEDKDLTGRNLTWEKAEGAQNEKVLWEPGCTYNLEKFKIKNDGNLALKYKIAINGIVGDAELLKAIDFTVSVDGGLIAKNEDVKTPATAEALNGFEGKLAANAETGLITVIGKMKTTAGNEFQDRSIDGISITVVATQDTVENDSFGNTYDEKAAYTWDGVTAVTDWYNSTDSEFDIKNANELAGVSKLASDGNTFKEKKLTLSDDIDLGDKKWTPIKSFEGEFDGNGKTISGLKLDSTEGSKPRAGLFNGVEAGSKIHDLKIDGVEATVGAGRVGVLGNYISGEVENIEIKNVKATSTSPEAWVGGLCALMSWPAVKNCTVENMEVSAPDGAAFIAGFSPIMQKNANFTFENCNVKNFKVNVKDESDDGCGVGGFVGQTQRGWEQPKMVNCHVTGIDITATGNVEIGGFMPWPGGHTIADNCSASGKIDATGVSEKGSVGGFFGNLGWNCDLGHMGHQITDCTADVDIVTKVAPAGGFVGTATNSYNRSMYATFKNCKAVGNVTCVNGGTASVGGFAGVADRGYYETCSATGTVSGGAVSGGFIGTVKHIDAAYDWRYPVGTREYEVEQITVKTCKGAAGLNLIGKDDKSNKDSLKRYHEIIIE